MSKVRIFEWAKANGKRSNEIVKLLQSSGAKVRNHTDLVEENVLKSLFNEIANSENSKSNRHKYYTKKYR